MIGTILVVLIILWFLGYIHLPFLPISDAVLFNLFGRAITLYDLLIFIVILWLIGFLPGLFRRAASILLIIWLLSFFGVIAIAGFSHVVVLVIIFSLIYYLLSGHH